MDDIWQRRLVSMYDVSVFSAGGAAAAAAAVPAIVSARPGRYRSRSPSNWIGRRAAVTRYRPFYSNHVYVR